MAADHRSLAQTNANVRLLPVGIATWGSLATTQAFGPFAPGDWVTIVIDGPAHVNAGASGGAAIATNPQLPAGVHDFVMPTGATHVHLFGAGSGNGCAFKSS